MFYSLRSRYDRRTMSDAAASQGRRLSPTRRSRKLIALDFIRRYFVQYGESPSLDEIGAALEVSKQRASELVEQLSQDEQLYRIAGKRRGIRLHDRTAELSEAEVLVRLAEMGWTVRDGDRLLQPPLTETGLMDLPFLDHKPGDKDRAGSPYGQEDGAGAGPARYRDRAGGQG